MNKILASLIGVAAVGSLSGVAVAHGMTKPQHGGVVQMNGETLFELVRAPAGVSLYVVDEDEPVSATSMTARLSVTAGSKRTEVPMTSAAGNRFVAQGLKLAPGANVGVLVVNKATSTRYGTTFIIK